jgi:hypothetical protein
MAKLVFTAKLNGGPDVTASGKIETLADLPRFLRGAEARVRQIVKLFPSLKSHKVVSVSIRPE